MSPWLTVWPPSILPAESDSVSMSLCPLCRSQAERFFIHKKQKRRFSRCLNCELVFQDGDLLSAEEERSRYELHNNSPDDEGYKGWLESFIRQAVIPYYRSGRILDFGSGPRPVLSDILMEKGYPVLSYDPFFSPSWPEGESCSLILLCEVLEHIFDPVKAFRLLSRIAAPDARLAVRTEFLSLPTSESFGKWWYKEDMTHVRFYNESSLRKLAEKSGWELVHQDGRSLAVFRLKPF